MVSFAHQAQVKPWQSVIAARCHPHVGLPRVSVQNQEFSTPPAIPPPLPELLCLLLRFPIVFQYDTTGFFISHHVWLRVTQV